MREIPVAAIGFVGPRENSGSPESAAAQSMGGKTAAAFPVSNRSLVLDLGEARLVHQLVMFDNKVDNAGTSPLIADHGLLLYTSNDGLTFTPYTTPFTITVDCGAVSLSVLTQKNGGERRHATIKRESRHASALGSCFLLSVRLPFGFIRRIRLWFVSSSWAE